MPAGAGMKAPAPPHQYTRMPQGVHFQSFTADGVAPGWLHIVPAGRFSGADGRGPYLLADAPALIAASMQAGKLPLDENHSTDLAAPKGEPSPARGWLVQMESRADGIWARVEWTEEGRALVAGHAYRGISPVFTTDEKGTLTRILRAALTNNPNLTDLATLHNPENSMDLPRLRSLLGLPDTADEAAVSAAIAARTEAATAHAALLADLAGQFGVAPEKSVKSF